MRPTFLFSLVALSLAAGAVHARPADPKPAPIQREQVSAEVSAALSSLMIEGIVLKRLPGGIVAKDNSFFVEKVSFGASNPVSIVSATGGLGAGKASFSEVSFQRQADGASLEILQAIPLGRSFKSAVIRLKGGMIITLSNVLISSYQLSMEDREGRPIENFSLAFGRIEVKFVDSTGNPVQGLAPMSWDVSKNRQ